MNEKATAWEEEDGALLRAVAEAGDREAFRRLFDRYYPRVFVFVLRRVRDEELASEIASDVFLEVWSSAASFRGDSKISSWIFGIGRFKCLEAIRSRNRLKRSRVISTEDEVMTQIPGGPAQATRLDARDELARVAVALGRVPKDQREALEWTVVEGRSLDEVARRQNVSRDTVKTRVSRARNSLRRMMGSTQPGALGAPGAGPGEGERS